MYERSPCTEGSAYLSDVLPLPQTEVIELYKKIWPYFGEQAWYGFIPRQSLAFDDYMDLTHKTLSDYFKHKKYNKHENSISVYDNGEDPMLENFAKLVWLTHDYFCYGGFEVPIGVHYNPRLEANVIHPGGSRNQILNLFGPDRIEALYFNTGGYQPPWLKSMKPVDIEDLAKNHEWAVGAVADHGTLIPHFARKTQWIPRGVKEFQRKLYQKLSPGMLRIKCRENLSFLNHWIVNDESEHDVKVKVKHTLSNKDQIKITLLVLANVDYKDKNYTVTCKNPIN